MRNGELIALLVCPDRDLAKSFADTQHHTKAFQVVAELKAYPTPQALEVRIRQTQPDVILLDVATDLELATQLIASVPGIRPDLYVVGLHHTNEPDAIDKKIQLVESLKQKFPTVFEFSRRLEELKQSRPPVAR